MKKFTTKILPRRLQGRGTSGDERKTITGPELSDARDFHQLTSRRGVAALNKRPTRNGMSRISVLPVDRDSESENNGTNENDAINDRDGKESENEQTNGHSQQQQQQQQQHDIPIVCQHCAAIGFPRLLDWKPGQPRPWVSLTHTLSDTSSCPYCTFFQAMIGDVPSLDASRGAGGDSETPSVSESDAGSAPLSYTGTFTPYLRIRHAFERMGVSQKHELGRQVLFEVTTKNKALPRGYILRCGEDEMGLDGYLESSEAAAGGDGGGGEEAKEKTAAAIRGRAVPSRLDPQVPKCWIEHCKANHGELRCGTAMNAVKDLRVIDAEERKVIAASDLDAGFEYVTLSYAAGEAYNDTESLEKTTDLPSELPPLIHDAISLTTSLGYRYVWIDQYCAPPPDTAASRRRYVDSLGDIFSSSALTIIVAAGNGLEDGIPGISVPRQDQLSLQNEAGLFTTTLVRPDIEVAASKWTTRTWTLQEGLLSRRRLVLTPSQAYFQCGALHCHESVSVPLRCAADFTLGRVFPLQGVEGMDIRRFIGSYMPRAYQRAEDRLDACRAIWRVFAKQTDARVDVFMGLPLFEPDAFANLKIVSQTDRLAVGLSWFISTRTTGSSSSATQPPPSSEADCSLDTSLYFPSWTWLAWNIRPDSDAAQNPRAFRIHLAANEGAAAAVVADGLCAPPGTEISVGFADGLVVSWEIDGEAIARRTERIAFLRVRTFCFDVLVTKNAAADDDAAGPGLRIEGEAEGVLDASAREAILSSVAAFGNGMVKEQHVKLTAVLIAGKNWKGDGPVEATALICAHREWDEDKPLVRIGLFGMQYDEFVLEASDGGDDEGHAVLKGVVGGDDGAGKGSLRADVREIDLY